MTKTLDIILTSIFLTLYGWGTFHGLIYDTFNEDATYNNSNFDKIFPLVSLVGCLLVIYSLFKKKQKSYLIYRLIGIGLILPLIVNYSTMMQDTNTIIIEFVTMTAFVILSLLRRFTK